MFLIAGIINSRMSLTRGALFFVALILGPEALLAHDIITTNLLYTRDISRIFARRCVACHNEQSSIPLTTYEEVRPWAVDIKEQVLSRAMPRWGAIKGFGDLLPDRALTQEEMIVIAAWVVGGAPNGDPALLPKSSGKSSAVHSAPDSHRIVVKTPTTLDADVDLAAMHPMGGSVIQSERVTAVLPDGRVEPLIWLYQYDPKWDFTFQLRRPALLPKNTRIESSRSLQLALEESKGSPPER